MATLYIKRGVYYVDFWIKGKRISKSLKLKATKQNKAKALKIKKEVERDIEQKQCDSRNETFESFKDIESKELTLEESTKQFINERFSSNTSDSHKRNFKIGINYLLKIIPPTTKVSNITSSDISKFIRTLETKVSNATLHTYILYVKMLFNYLVDEDYLIKSPVKKKLMPKREKKNVVSFDDAILKRILDEALIRDEKLYNVLQMFLLTGARPSDVLNFKVGDFNFAEKILYIRISKTNREIKFPLYDELLTFIEANMKDDFNQDNTELVFKSFTVNSVSKRFMRIKKKLGLKEKFVYTLKTFRKTFATRMAKRGVPIHEVAYMLGHESIQTTKKYYTEVLVENLREKINTIN